MYMVTKRDGTKAAFDVAKISAAITKAFEAQRHRHAGPACHRRVRA